MSKNFFLVQSIKYLVLRVEDVKVTNLKDLMSTPLKIIKELFCLNTNIYILSIVLWRISESNR